LHLVIRRIVRRKKSTLKLDVKEMNGMTDQVAPFIYIDANPFIYAVEGNDALVRPIKDLFTVLRRIPGAAVTSELTLAEMLPKALSSIHRQTYLDLMIRSGVIVLRPVTRDILLETASYRRMTATARPDGRVAMPKLPDAIHVVTAIKSSCKKCLSRDGGIKVPAGMVLTDANADGIAALIGDIRGI